jgi:hypothetical protein
MSKKAKEEKKVFKILTVDSKERRHAIFDLQQQPNNPFIFTNRIQLSLL